MTSSSRRSLTTGAARGKTAKLTLSSPPSSRRNGMAPAPVTPTWPSDDALRRCRPGRSVLTSLAVHTRWILVFDFVCSKANDHEYKYPPSNYCVFTCHMTTPGHSGPLLYLVTGNIVISANSSLHEVISHLVILILSVHETWPHYLNPVCCMNTHA